MNYLEYVMYFFTGYGIIAFIVDLRKGTRKLKDNEARERVKQLDKEKFKTEAKENKR